MISAPMSRLWRSAKASSTPAEPPASQNRVPNIHSCSRSPACPNGASADCGSPVAKPSREMARLWIRVRDIRALLDLRSRSESVEDADQGDRGFSSAIEVGR
jgi:hypothetical protein